MHSKSPAQPEPSGKWVHYSLDPSTSISSYYIQKEHFQGTGGSGGWSSKASMAVIRMLIPPSFSCSWHLEVCSSPPSSAFAHRCRLKCPCLPESVFNSITRKATEAPRLIFCLSCMNVLCAYCVCVCVYVDCVYVCVCVCVCVCETNHIPYQISTYKM